MSDLITEIPRDLEHGWETSVNGESADVRQFRASHPKFGTLSWGKRPEGPNAVGWSWKEAGGGGVGVIPYVLLGEQLLIGMIAQNRPTMGDEQYWQIPRGFVDPDQPLLKNAAGELAEEVGELEDLHSRLQPLAGEAENCNSTFFDTRGGGGFRYYAFEMNADELEKNTEGIQLKSALFNPVSTMGERITACHFFPWKTAAMCADGFSSSGAARLLAHFPELLPFV